MGNSKTFERGEEFDEAEYANEAKETWGQTDAYKESMRRARLYTSDDWAKVKSEGEEVDS